MPDSGAAEVPAGPFRGELKPMNHGSGSGTVNVVLQGSRAVITAMMSGLPGKLHGKPYPHPLQLHVEGRGQCPTTNAADTNNDGVVSIAEGKPAYGRTAARLGAPTGRRFSYSRTITLDADSAASLRSGKAVLVVQGVDPRTVPGKARRLAKNLPVLCGTLLSVTGPGTAPGGPGAPPTGVNPPPVR